MKMLYLALMALLLLFVAAKVTTAPSLGPPCTVPLSMFCQNMVPREDD
jgi:hypothetical protein